MVLLDQKSRQLKQEVTDKNKQQRAARLKIKKDKNNIPDQKNYTPDEITLLELELLKIDNGREIEEKKMKNQRIQI